MHVFLAGTSTSAVSTASSASSISTLPEPKSSVAPSQSSDRGQLPIVTTDNQADGDIEVPVSDGVPSQDCIPNYVTSRAASSRTGNFFAPRISHDDESTTTTSLAAGATATAVSPSSGGRSALRLQVPDFSSVIDLSSDDDTASSSDHVIEADAALARRLQVRRQCFVHRMPGRKLRSAL